MPLINLLLKVIYFKLNPTDYPHKNTQNNAKVIRSKNNQFLILNYIKQNTIFLNQYEISNGLFYSLIMYLGSLGKLDTSYSNPRRGEEATCTQRKILSTSTHIHNVTLHSYMP